MTMKFSITAQKQIFDNPHFREMNVGIQFRKIRDHPDKRLANYEITAERPKDIFHLGMDYGIDITNI